MLFPKKPYHALLKDDKLQSEDLNNPLNDSIKARDLFFDEVASFQLLDQELKRITCHLLKQTAEFGAFFDYIDFNEDCSDLEAAIRERFGTRFCQEAPINQFITTNPIELAYCLVLINTDSRYSITPPWVIKKFPLVQNIMFLLRSKPCLAGCNYCKEALDIHMGLKRFFGFDSYRKYDGEPLQERAAKAAVDNKSLLSVFPTGGGKSITFQVPALMSGMSAKGLTVVISPLQSLMKDQVDNLEKAGLLGKVGTIEKSDQIIQETIKRIKCGDVEISRITKTVLVIDEAQDMNADEYGLITALMEQNEEMRIVAVGDDDQSIFDNPIHAVQGDLGRIKWTKHKGENLILPLVNEVLQEGFAGTTCILTRTNEEVSQITGLLIKNGLRARLIQSNDGFNLFNLSEIRFFISQLGLTDETYSISDETWANAKRQLAKEYIGSNNLEVCMNLVKDFESINAKTKYRSDLEVFIKESKLEDFDRSQGETIYVSTMHKAKGREFNNVFLMLNQLSDRSDASLRLIYVAISRAINYLNIHDNNNYFNSIYVDGSIVGQDRNLYQQPAHLAFQLTYRDLWLDSFMGSQSIIPKLKSGDKFFVDRNCCLNKDGEVLMRFSKQFVSRIADLNKKGYEVKSGKINYIVYWERDDIQEEMKIILPEIYFDKID